MESEKETSNGQQFIADTDRRVLDKNKAERAGISMSPLRVSLNPSTRKITKRVNLSVPVGLYRGGQAACMTSAKKCYSSFTRSGVPKRLMYYQSGKWSDFPGDLVDIVKKDLWMNKATSQVEFNGQAFVLDFVHMMLLNLKTGLGQSIAWIDEADQCFFPETFLDDDEFHNSGYHDEGDDQKHQSEMPHQNTDLKLKLEIDVNGVDCQSLVKHNDVVKTSDVGNCNAEVEVAGERILHSTAITSSQPFLHVLAVIADKVQPEDMSLLLKKFKLLQMRKLTHREYVTGLRLMVGDPLIRYAMQKLQHKANKNPNSEPDAAPKEVGSSTNRPLKRSKQPSPE